MLFSFHVLLSLFIVYASLPIDLSDFLQSSSGHTQISTQWSIKSNLCTLLQILCASLTTSSMQILNSRPRPSGDSGNPCLTPLPTFPGFE